MTAAKSTLRTRRSRPAGSIPPGVLAWFAGQANVDAAGWHALLYEQERCLLQWWAAWGAEHPGARPPTDAPWIRWGAT
jgi:hypothetical protein